MQSFRRRLLANFFKLFDLLGLTGSFLLAIVITYQETGVSSLDQFFSVRIKIQNFAIFLGLVLIWHIIFSSFRLYNSRRLSSRRKETLDVLKANSVATLVLILAVLIFRIKMAIPLFILTFWATSSAITILSRLLLRYFLGEIRLHGRNLRHILIVGTNHRAIQFAQKIEAQKELGYKILGFVDSKWHGINEFQHNGHKVVADFAEFPAYLQNNVVDEVMIALPLKSLYQQASRIVALCEEQGIICRYLSEIFNTRMAYLEPGHFDGNLVISHYTGIFDPISLFLKRIIDIVISLPLLVLLVPLFLLVALLIKRDSPGPVFFIQSRPGFNKRPFKMLKFRTMVKDADKMINEVVHLNGETGPAFKIKNDPRITKIGSLLRKTSIDELPQLINILIGEMSLVGPRPLFYWEFERIEEQWVKRRLSVKPGLTGLWQVNGRSNLTFEKRIQMDLHYIDNWSLLLDFWILVQTFPVVVFGKGAV